MFTTNQLIAHLFGDYLIQSSWMARHKATDFRVALAHGMFYGIPFLLLRPSLAAWLVIVITHALIDRGRLARYVVWAKERLLSPPWHRVPPLAACPTGYDPAQPEWLNTWLFILTDNILHLLINGAALRWL